jgi:hypothetical protein
VLADLDFNSFADGKYAYLLEATYAPTRDNGGEGKGTDNTNVERVVKQSVFVGPLRLLTSA